MNKKHVAMLFALTLATVFVAGCGSGDQSLPNGGKGLLGSQPLNGKAGAGNVPANAGKEAQAAASGKSADKAEPGGG